MRLNYVEIQGFKSFPDKTRITFEAGFTSIVGPNGSGKSNISDAVRWVLGEQSSKSLRGGKMEDVIFGGTKLRKPMGFAQVSLCLDDVDASLLGGEEDFEKKQVVVSRRYYRSGDSEYLINGAAVRLRDVREMFMDTGLGRDGYSIIGQGKIAEIVAAKSSDRRELFEEASGIAKFRFRKNEATDRLNSTEDNLSRLRDILGELSSRLEPLEKQRDEALRFLQLSEEKKSLEITLYCDTIERTRNSLRAQDEKIETARRDYERVEGDMADIDKKTEQCHELNREHNLAIERLNEEIEKHNANIAAAESDIAVRRNDISHAEEQIESLKATLAGVGESGEGVRREIEQKNLEIEGMLAELEKLDGLAQQAQAELDALDESAEAVQSLRAEASKRLADLQSRLSDLRVEVTAAQASLELLEKRTADVSQRAETARTRLNELTAERGENESYLREVESEISQCENLIKAYDMKLASRNESTAKLTAELEKKRIEMSDAKNRANMLREMERSMEGFSQSVKRVAEAARSHELRGIIGTVASLLNVRSGYELAIETALGAAAQNIVVEDERAAKQAIAYLKDKKAGRATFLPLDTIKPSHFDDTQRLSDSGIVGLASGLVSYEKKYDNIVSNLLGRIVVAEELDSASMCARRLNYRNRIVTLDGQVINAGGSYTGGSSSRNAGIFSRKSEIESLDSKAKKAEEECRETNEKLEKLLHEKQELEAQRSAAAADLANRTDDRVRINTALAQQNTSITGLEATIAEAEADLKKMQAEREQNESAAARAKNEITEVEGEIETASAGADDAQGDDIIRRRTALAAELSERRIKRVEKQKDIESARYAIEQLERQQTDAAGRTDEITKSIAALGETAEQHKAYIDARSNDVNAERAAVESCRAEIAECVQKRQENERELTQSNARYSELARQREDFSREIARLEERKVALQSDFDSANSKLWEDYELTRAEAKAYCVEFESVTELRSQVQSLRAKIRALGSVNVGAIEEFKEVSSRAQFMTAQIADVEKSRDSLLELISGLEQQMTEIFTANFSEINAQFRKAFAELFGGGSANLYLSDESDILGSGIELDVQPPGKIIKNLAALSGGEQALVAIALYFAILSVNPSPFCILDEIDSALDDSNVTRFANYLRRIIDRTQIIAITHRRGTMEAADVLYGVTMQEEGVSRVLKLSVEEASVVIQN